MLKPRKGKFAQTDGLKHKMASPANVLLGTFMLWWGMARIQLWEHVWGERWQMETGLKVPGACYMTVIV